MPSRRMTLCLALPLFLLPAAGHAQEATAEPTEAAVLSQDAGDAVQQMRDRLHLLLLRGDVRQTARDHDIDLRPLHEGIDQLGPDALGRIAPYADAVEDADGTAAAITISTTTIILALLVIILLVLVL